MATIHPTAIVADGAVLGEGVTVGPFCTVGADVVLGEGTELLSHVVVDGDTHLGPGCRVFPFASIGMAPQDLKFSGERTTLRIGARVVMRENVTVNPGTQGGGGKTVIGDDCHLLAGAHVAHDCHVGHHCVLVNNCMIAGHCSLGDHVIVGGGAGLHQFVRVGEHAFIGGLSGVENDVIPFATAIGNRAHLGGLNLIGLKRRGFARSDIHALRAAYAEFFDEDAPAEQRQAALRNRAEESEAVAIMAAFIAKGGSRALCGPRRRGHG